MRLRFNHILCMHRVCPLSEYGPIFKLSTEISGYTAYTPPFTGDDILSCFGFDEGRFSADLLIVAAIGVVGLLLAFGLLKRG